MMADDRDEWGSLLTVKEVRERGVELRDLESHIERLQARKRAIFEWLDVVGRLIGRDRLNDVLSSSPENDSIAKSGDSYQEEDRKSSDKASNGTASSTDANEVPAKRGIWTEYIENLAIDSGGKISFAEARVKVSEDDLLGPILEKTDKSFHGAIAKLAKSGRIVRHKGWIFTPEAYRTHSQAVARGEAKDDFGYTARAGGGSSYRPSPMADAIQDFLRTKPNGATGSEIIDHVMNFERFHDVVERNHTSVYNVLTRLVKRDELRKDGKIYLAPHQHQASCGDARESVAE